MRMIAVAMCMLLAGCVSAERQVMEDVEAAKVVCRSQGFAKKIDLARCINDAERRFARVYPNPDLLQLRLASRLAIAEKQDRGELSDAEAELEFAKVGAQIGSQEQARSTNAQMANAASLMATPRPTTCTRFGNTVNCF